MKNYKLKLISTHAAAGTLVKAIKGLDCKKLFNFLFNFTRNCCRYSSRSPSLCFLCVSTVFLLHNLLFLFLLCHVFLHPLSLSASWPRCGFEVMQAWLFLALRTSVLLCCPLHLQYLLCPDGPDAQPNCHSKLAMPHTPLSILMSTPASAGSVLYSQHYFSSYHHTLVTGS